MTSWDSEVKGLHTITTPAGAAYYLYYRTKSGQQRRSKLGDLGILTLQKARMHARIILAQVTLGGDPFGEMRIARGELTVGDVYRELYAERYEKAKTRWAKEVQWNWAKHLEKAFGYRKLSAVTAPDVREWHIRYEASPYAGNRSKSVLSTVFKYAELRGYRKPGSNPCSAVPNHPEVKRSRYASTPEMQRLGEILRREYASHPREVLFIYLLIFTGSRPSAVERSTWNNVEIFTESKIEYGILRVEGKTGEDLMPIPPLLLKALREIHTPEYGNSLTGIKFPRTFWERVRLEAGCSDLWARDWRRTYATTGLSKGISVGIVGELLNHKDPRMTARYAKLLIQGRMKASLQIGTELARNGLGPSPG